MKKNPNRLIYEKSPYLLQHAHNPVDWRPWGGMMRHGSSGCSGLKKRVFPRNPFIKNLEPMHGKATAYVCTNFTCRRPTTNANDMLGLLNI